MADIRSSITCPKLVDLYDYWDRIRGIRNVPIRADFDPIDIPKLLPYIMLYDVERGPIRFRIRLEGTAVAAVRRRPGTGRYLDEPGIVVLHNGVIEAFTRMIADRQPWYSEGSFRLEDGRSGHLHRLALPLSRDGISVDMILVGFVHKLTKGQPSSLGPDSFGRAATKAVSSVPRDGSPAGLGGGAALAL